MVTVLIADDEVNVAEGLASGLDWQSRGCTVVGVAYDGQQALNIALREKPDIIITDITMPRLTGLELMDKLKASCPQTCFIVLTCHEDFAFAREALRLEACDYIVKETMTRDELYVSVEKAKQQFFQRRELSSRAIVQEDPELKHMVHYIQEHVAQRITLEEMANEMAMNPSYFSRFFKQKMGETFSDYVIRTRMQYAMEKLRCTHLPVQQIAEQAGFSNLSYFHMTFKRIVGMTPAAYRRTERTKQDI